MFKLSVAVQLQRYALTSFHCVSLIENLFSSAKVAQNDQNL